jgi:hypothetical protein
MWYNILQRLSVLTQIKEIGDLAGSRSDCEDCNRPSGFIKGGEFLDHLSRMSAAQGTHFGVWGEVMRSERWGCLRRVELYEQRKSRLNEFIFF